MVVVNSVLTPHSSYFNPLLLSRTEADLDLGLEYVCSLESLGIDDGDLGSIDKQMLQSFKQSISFSNNQYEIELP